MHLLAQQEADARREIVAAEKSLYAVISERDSALRTIRNLHARLENLGFTP